mmetsp:Transcript_15772/g.43678  ORF Transcript_15772/g.43678 Transcript_15772/m.43678 type:complete len:281 (+) Transcript_15772:1423-2265(+)
MELERVDGLGQEVVHARGKGIIALRHQCGSGQRNDGQLGRREVLAQLAGGIMAAQHRHLHIHQHDVEGLAHAGGGQHGLHRLAAVAGLGDLHAPLLQLGYRDQHVDRMVLGDQHAPALQGRAGPHLARLVAHRRRCGRQGQLGPEHRALARRAAQADLAAHQRGQLAADGQAQAGAAITPRRRFVGLRERLEQALLLVERDARAGVGHLDMHPFAGTALAVAGQRPDPHRNATLLGELQRIAGQVQQHLAQSRGISDQRRRQPGVQREQHLDVLVAHMGG